MAFTPSNQAAVMPRNIVLGRDITAIKGTIHRGSIVTILECDGRGYTVQDHDSGEIITECGFDIFE